VLYQDSSNLLQAAIDGQGIALVRRSLAIHEIAAGRLVRLFDVDGPSPWAYYFVCPPRLLETARVQAFRSWLLEEVVRFQALYGRACAAGVAAVRADCEIICFLDGDGSDVPAFMPVVIGPLARGEADFVMGSRLRGKREPGSMTPQQLLAGRLAGVMMRLVYGVRFSDMSPFRAMRARELRALGMREQTYGWNLEMQMRVAAASLRILEVPVDHRCRRGGVSKVSGNLAAGLSAAWKISTTFVRLAASLRGS